MFRTQRVGALLTVALHGLSIQSPLAASAMGVGAVALLAGCQDDSQPEYWIDKLDDVAWRPRAIKRLDQFFEDAVARANDNAEDAQVKALVDKIVPPLTKVYAERYEMLDAKERLRLIKLLATVRDERAEPALSAALSHFGTTGLGGEEAMWAARAVADLRLEASAGPMLAAFQKTRAGTAEGRAIYKDLSKSMVSVANKAWAPALLEMLEPRMTMPKKQEDAAGIAEFQNQLFWQTTAAQVLGEIGAAEAAVPLMKVVLDPAKANAHATAIMALVKLGKPAVDVATKVLLDQDAALAKYAAERGQAATGAPQLPKDRPHVRMAAIVLGTLGHAAAASALEKAFASESVETNRAIIARELTKLPATTSLRKAFVSAFDELSPTASIGPASAKTALAEAAAGFFDPDLVPWLIDKSEEKKGDEEAQVWMRLSAIKLMGPGQVRDVGRAVGKAKDPQSKKAFDLASKVVSACKKDTACYLEKAQKTTSDSEQFAAIKALYMLGVLGDEKTRDSLIAGLEPIRNAALRYVAAQVIDHLSPEGSKRVADELQKIIDENAATRDRNKIAADKSIKDVMYRIRSRASA